MQSDEVTLAEESLDPEDWDGLRALGHRMLDDMLDYLQTVRDRPLWQSPPPDVRARLRQPLPVEPQGAAQTYADFQTDVLPYPMGNIHPRFWGWVIGTGTAGGMLADLLASGMNPNVGGADHGAVYVEAQVLDWCKELVGYPSAASGLLVSGGSMANLVGLAVGRNVRAGFDVRRQGVAASPGRLVLYGSVEMHSSLQKSVELLGLGDEALRRIPVNADYEIDLAALEAAIAADRAAGLRPLCVIGTAGTVNTGAIDDLSALADLCAREGLWFHVDGAFGAVAALAPEIRPRLRGMERADSLAFDLHKWLYVNYEAGCVLVRDAEAHRDTFAVTPKYLAHLERGLASGEIWFSEYGLQLSRSFKALKIWFSLKEHGAAKYARLVQQNLSQAQYLAGKVDAAPDLERLAPVPLNIVCFRYNPGGLDDAALNALNQEVLMRLHESGLAAPSYTTLDGRYALRAAITNHRSRREDFDLLVETVQVLGAQIREAVA